LEEFSQFNLLWAEIEGIVLKKASLLLLVCTFCPQLWALCSAEIQAAELIGVIVGGIFST
jgi:hypothetical protein